MLMEPPPRVSQASIHQTTTPSQLQKQRTTGRPGTKLHTSKRRSSTATDRRSLYGWRRFPIIAAL